MSEQDPSRSKTRRSTIILSVVLVALLLLLAAVAYFFLKVLMPAGAADTAGTSGSGMQWVRSIYGYGDSAAEQLLGPTAVAVAPDGTIYAVDPQHDRILAFHPDGRFRGMISTGAASTAAGKLGRPVGIATDKNGNVYISDEVNSKIMVFDSRLRFVREWLTPQALGIEVVGDTLYARTLHGVMLYTLTGKEKAHFGQFGRGMGAAMNRTGGLTADASQVYLADALNQSIKAYKRDGSLAWAMPKSTATTGTASLSVGSTATATESSSATESAIDLPQDLTLDANGRLIAIDAFSFQILVMDPKTGALQARYGDSGTSDGKFMYPSGIAYDSARDWFVVADTANNRLQIVRIPGSGGGFRQAASRALSSPFRVCGLPLAALLIALIVLLTSRKRRERAAEAQPSVSEA